MPKKTLTETLNELYNDIKRRNDGISLTNDSTKIVSNTLGLTYDKKSQPEILNTVVEGKPIAGQFIDKNMQAGFAYDLLKANSENISTILSMTSDNEPMYFSIYKQQVESDLKSGGYIKSADGFYHRYENNNIGSIEVQKNNESSFGFDIKKVSPTIEADLAGLTLPDENRYRTVKKPEKIILPQDKLAYIVGATNEDLTDTMKQTDAFTKASPLNKARLLISSNPKLSYGGNRFDAPAFVDKRDKHIISISDTTLVDENKKPYFMVTQNLSNDAKNKDCFECKIYGDKSVKLDRITSNPDGTLTKTPVEGYLPKECPYLYQRIIKPSIENIDKYSAERTAALDKTIGITKTYNEFQFE